MKIIIVGKAGSGKDYMKSSLVKKGMKGEVSFTTRKRRENEINGRDYHFIEEEDFLKMIKAGQFLQYDKFGEFYYGTSMKEWVDKEIFIMSPAGIKKLSKLNRSQATVFYLDICEKQRVLNIQDRKMSKEELEKRIKSDEEAFFGFDDYDIAIKEFQIRMETHV